MIQSLIYHGGGYNGNGFSAAGSTIPVYKELVVAYSATITLDASIADYPVYEIVLSGNPTLAAPLNPSAAQKIIIRFVQDATGGRTVTYNAIFRFGVTLPSPTLTISPYLHDYLCFVYNGVDSKWDYIGEAFGI